MKIAVVSGSQRHNSQSSKVAGFAVKLLRQFHGAETTLIDLSEVVLPLWTDHVAESDNQTALWQPVSVELKAADGMVVVSPEWNGMATPALKNFFLYCTDHELTDKPGYIVGVTSGTAGGNYCTSDLRLSGFKDTQLCYLPEQVIVRAVADIMNEPDPQSEADAYTRARMNHGLGLLIEYSRALRSVRDAGVRNFEHFPYGM